MPQRQESAFLIKAAGPLPQVEDVTLCLPGTTVALQSGIQETFFLSSGDK